jgi:hypothetical protein
MHNSVAAAFMLVLAATATCCTPSAGSAPADRLAGGTLRTFEIAAAKVRCTGVMPMECFRIRRLPDTNWELFYDSIVGFEYEPGFTYVIEVFETQVNPAPADASGLSYRLRRIVSKRRAD